MGLMDSVKRILGIRPINIGELNRRATAPPTIQCIRPEPRVAEKSKPAESIIVSDEYRDVEELINGKNPIVFVTGNAGTGKSTLISYLRSSLKQRMVVVAPTGVAALNAAGVTIHSFFQFPPKLITPDDIKQVYDRKLYQKLELLVVDEVSMVRCDIMDGMDQFLRKNRASDLPFGGVQLLLVGDLYQLAPIAKKPEREVLKNAGYDSEYFFSARVLENSGLVPVVLTHSYRHKDSEFLDILNKVRAGADPEAASRYLNEKCLGKAMSGGITLTCTNSRADHINMKELSTLQTVEAIFHGTIEGQFKIEEDRLPAPMNLRLKFGARIMFTKNDDNHRWVNGTFGYVTDLREGKVRVRVDGERIGTIYDVPRVTWETYKYKYDADLDQIVAVKVGQYTQYPLMLAWAVTIHKSQGQTLDNVYIDLGSGAFASGQTYVALSRCRSIDGISLARGIRPADIKCDPVIQRFYKALDEYMAEETMDTGEQGVVADLSRLQEPYSEKVSSKASPEAGASVPGS